MCLQTFPGPMTTFRNKIETLILNELEEHSCPKVNMSHVTRKSVFGVFDQVRLKPACSAIEAR